jgi:glycosyltransferase involved in cell wall biosynthesis
VKVTVAIVTYRRAWALPHSLTSIVNQTRKPDEVLVVLRPSGDGSEEVIKKFSSQLPIRLILQKEGNCAYAYQLAIDNANGDLILFIDDDVVAEMQWVEKYVQLFDTLPKAGGVTGRTFKAYLKDGAVAKTQEEFYEEAATRPTFYRRPLPEYSDYTGWVSRSGYMGMRTPPNGVFKSALLGGVNMALYRDAVAGVPLARLYRRSRRCLWFESLLAYYARKRGFDTYGVRGPQAPVVWHLVHERSLTRGRGFWHEFWIHYDRVANYWRLKKLGAQVSPYAYLAACLVSLRRRPLPRLLATLYGWLVRL